MVLRPKPSPLYLRKQAFASTLIDPLFVGITKICAITVALLLLAIAWQVFTQAWPAIQQFGLGFWVETAWNPVKGIYGAWPHLYGTLLTALLALIMALPIGLGVALFLSEDFLPTFAQTVLAFLIELLAAIPSVVYGIWGLLVLVPLMRPFGLWIHNHPILGEFPVFSTAPVGPGLYAAATVLAIMILPIIAAIARESLMAVPPELREASISLGATRWETIFKVLIPAASSGIIGGTMLALGRALGETMAVTLLIGNANQIPKSIFDASSTVAALLANQFAEARGLQVASLMYAALLLFGLTLLVNILAELIVRRIRQI